LSVGKGEAPRPAPQGEGMKLFSQDYGRPGGLPQVSQGFRAWRVRRKLLVALIPPVAIILIVTGYITSQVSSEFLNEAIERIVRIQTVSIAHGVEDFLKQCREDLLLLAQAPVTRKNLAHFHESRLGVKGYAYREVGFLAGNGRDHIFLATEAEDPARLSEVAPALLGSNPLLLLEKVSQLNRNDVWISGLDEVAYPQGQEGSEIPKRTVRMIRLATPCFDEQNAFTGFLLLGIDLRQVRDILTLYNSKHSPIFAFVRSPELRFSYFFDPEGWVLFQSGEAGAKNEDLSTDKVRNSFADIAGTRGAQVAFRPEHDNGTYWQMVEDVRGGRHGVIRVKAKQSPDSWMDSYFLGYAPVRFVVAPYREPIIIGGVAFADRSRLTLWAGYRQIDVVFVITLATTLLIALLIVGLGRTITKPILELAKAVNLIQESGALEEIRLADRDQETSFLKRAINNMIRTLRAQMEEIRVKDEKLQAESQREKARLEEEVNTLRQRLQSQEIGEIVGVGPVVEIWKADILKAASVDVDVVITGETGTGKQLTAEAIHRHSKRADRPFISINCGALDENLLLDSLFGHVKGAFTEAKSDRKGAFLTAHGGTLFLDEIGTASARVQQALLRAISIRKIRPLGSDRETEVDVRLIAASNVDLRGLIEKGLFREDLYYRLAVVMIRTPALRDMKENVPILVEHFYREATLIMDKDQVGFSKAALEKLKSYHWPGNVREIKNCITRTVAMAQGNLIHAEDIRLSDRDLVSRVMDVHPAAVEPRRQASRRETADLELNARQRLALPLLLDKGEVTRSEYQRVVGNNLPPRTALYDLQDLVKKGVLTKSGRGPATRYLLAKLPDLAR
jgi:DNA-binding NtrC family response regulator